MGDGRSRRSPLAIDAIRIAWAEPFADRYRVQYWTGEDPIEQPTKGAWMTFPGGTVERRPGRHRDAAAGPVPMPVRYLRIWMTESSNTCDSHGPPDRRNCVGYAIRELYLGTLAPNGEFHDLVRHTADQDRPRPSAPRSTRGTSRPTSPTTAAIR